MSKDCIQELRDWILKEVAKADREIDQGKAFYVREARKEALLEVYERLAQC